MNKKSFFIDEVKVNSANSPESLWERIKLAWKVLARKPLTLSNALRVTIGENCEMEGKMWVKPPEQDWQYRAVTFDGVTAIGYVDGVKV